MFSRNFYSLPNSSNTIEVSDNIKKSLLETIKNNDKNTFVSLLLTYKIDCNYKKLDIYDNSLLHIAILNRSYDIVSYLIHKDSDINCVNQFNETPISIAIKNQDEKMIKIILNFNKYEIENSKVKEDNIYLKNENTRLNDKIKNLEYNNNKLLDSNKILTQQNNYLSIQLDNEKQNKRKFDIYEEERLLLKNENKRLKEDNAILQNTVKTLKDLAKK
jgi:ankyrin repeat protein